MKSSENPLLTRIAQALERMAPAEAQKAPLDGADAFVWHAEGDQLEPVRAVNRVALDLLLGIDHARDTLLDNTRRFAKGLPANNALLWGARGTGKSSLVKAVHAHGRQPAKTLARWPAPCPKVLVRRSGAKSGAKR